MNDFCIEMLLQFNLNPGYDSKSCTISICPLPEAKIKGVSSSIEKK